MKKNHVLVALFILFISLQLAAGDDVLLKLPVRVVSKGQPVLTLKKADFSFYINEQRKEIIDLLGTKRTLSKADEPRNFVLAFNLTEYGQQISEGISYFVEHVLDKNDSLIILTPLKMYRIAVSDKKVKIVEDIEKIVKKDSLNFKKNKISSRDNLLREIRKVNRGGSITSGGKAGNTTDLTTTTIMQFLNDYNREWGNFKTKFLFPDLRQYSSLAMLLAKQSGEKWFINFQQREIMPALGEFKKAADSIRGYLSSVTSTEDQAAASSISSGLQTLEKAMLVSENFPRQILANLLMGANFSYNVILFRSLRQDISNPDAQSPDYEGILRDFSEQTGGKDLDTTDLKEGIGAIMKNTDFYYDLIFKFEGTVEDKNIRVEAAVPGAKIFYKDKFYKSEIQNLIDYLKEPKINISGFSIKGNQIRFTIGEFKIDKVENQQAGLMAVKIELKNDKHDTVFKTSKTLKSIKKSITISLPLPATHKGYFQLHIQARDLLSQKSHDLNKYIKLK